MAVDSRLLRRRHCRLSAFALLLFKNSPGKNCLRSIYTLCPDSSRLTGTRFGCISAGEQAIRELAIYSGLCGIEKGRHQPASLMIEFVDFFVSTKFHFDETISLAGLMSSFVVVRRSCHIYGNFAMG